MNTIVKVVYVRARFKANIQKKININMVKDGPTSFITKSSTFRCGNSMTEAVAEVARIKASIQKWYNSIDKDDTSSYILRSDHFRIRNTITEDVD